MLTRGEFFSRFMKELALAAHTQNKWERENDSDDNSPFVVNQKLSLTTEVRRTEGTLAVSEKYATAMIHVW